MLSIVIPANGEKEYPQKCIDSLLNQNGEDWEVVVVSYCKKPVWQSAEDDRIRLFNIPEVNCSDACNQGIRMAAGDYILFLDPETWLDPDAVSIFMETVEEHSLDVLRFGCIREYRTRNLVARLPFVSDQVCRDEELEKVKRQTVGLIGSEVAYSELVNGLSMANFSVYRKSVIDEHDLQFEDVAGIKLFSDCLFNLGYLSWAKSFLYLETPLCHCETPQAYGLSPAYRENYLGRQQEFFEKLRKFSETQTDPRFMEAYYNRVSFSTPDICLNVLKSERSKKEQYKEFKRLKISEEHRAAYQMLELRQLPSAWRMYYFYAKYGWTRRLYSMTKTIRAYQK